MANGWTTPAEEVAKAKAYEDELVRRYLNEEPLTKTDARDARRIIKARAKRAGT